MNYNKKTAIEQSRIHLPIEACLANCANCTYRKGI